MTIPIDGNTVGVWMVASPKGPAVFVLASTDDGAFSISGYLNNELLTQKSLLRDSQATLIDMVRRQVSQTMEQVDTDRGWEALRGHRSMEEFMTVLRALPGFKLKEKTSDNTR